MTRKRKGILAMFTGFAIASCEPPAGIMVALVATCAVIITAIPLED